MTAQLALDMALRPLARRTDPSTSHTAAARTDNLRRDHLCRILDALDERDGHIYDIAQRCGLTHVQVARRLPELQTAGEVTPTDEVRVGPTGRGCRVWARAR